MPRPSRGTEGDSLARDVDRLLAQLSGGGHAAAAPPSTSIPQRRITRVSSSTTTISRAVAVGLWARVALGVTLGALVTQWPYPRACGWSLAAYLGAVSMVVVAGLWIALVSWKLRSGAAHAVAFLLLIWGMVLAAERVLPRVGYAADRSSWLCAEETAVPS
jgi:heme A synthase